MKYWSIFILAIFLNFTALPSLAFLFDWELPTLSTNITEEELKSNFASFNEKIPPKPFNFHDFLTGLKTFKTINTFILKDDSIHLSPYISIFSPPPEA